MSSHWVQGVCALYISLEMWNKSNVVEVMNMWFGKTYSHHYGEVKVVLNIDYTMCLRFLKSFLIGDDMYIVIW